MVAFLDRGTMVGPWAITDSIAPVGQIQRYAAEHLLTGEQAIVVCAKCDGNVRLIKPEQRRKRLFELREAMPSRFVPVLDCGEWSSLEWVVVACPPENTMPLSHYLMEHGPLSESLAAALIRDLLEAILAHEHLWLRPQCLWIDEQCTLVAISDFGLASLFSDVRAPFDACIAPEQYARMEHERADIYAAGVILYQALVGYEPFCGQKDSVARACIEGIPSVRAEGAELLHADTFDALIAIFTEKRPEERSTLEEALLRVGELAARLKAAPPASLYPYKKPVFEEEILELPPPASERRLASDGKDGGDIWDEAKALKHLEGLREIFGHDDEDAELPPELLARIEKALAQRGKGAQREGGLEPLAQALVLPGEDGALKQPGENHAPLLGAKASSGSPRPRRWAKWWWAELGLTGAAVAGVLFWWVSSGKSWSEDEPFRRAGVMVEAPKLLGPQAEEQAERCPRRAESSPKLDSGQVARPRSRGLIMQRTGAYFLRPFVRR